MRTFREIHELVFGSRPRTLVAFSAPAGPLPLMERLRSVAPETTFRPSEIEKNIALLVGRHPVMVTAYDLMLERDVPPGEVIVYLERRLATGVNAASCDIAFINKTDALGIFEEYFAFHSRTEPSVRGDQGERCFTLRAGQHLYTATFSLAALPRM